MIEIVNRYTRAVLYKAESAESVRDALIEAVQKKADLGGADLRSAYLRSADLRSADLGGAYLGGADLRGADLRGANLSGANLGGADLRSAYLGGADLRSAYLRGADLRSANLGGADLRSAYLRSANLGDLTVMPDGRKWSEYKLDHLAGICQTPDIKAKAIAAWGNHTWSDCPMHCALGIRSASQASEPLLVSAWVALYDAHQLTAPVVESAAE
jgi:hypothetical protein